MEYVFSNRRQIIGLNQYVKCISFFFPVLIEPIPVGQAAKDYLNLYVIPTLLKGLTALSKKKPADPFVGITRKTRIKRQNEYVITTGSIPLLTKNAS